MDKQYDEGQRRARDLEHKIKDYLDDPSNPVAQRLINESRKIEDDFQTRRNPRSIEDHIRQVVHIFDELRRFETPIMDAQHARWLHDQYEHLQMSLRKFENY